MKTKRFLVALWLVATIVLFILAPSTSFADDVTYDAPVVRYDLQGGEVWNQQLPNGTYTPGQGGPAIAVSGSDAITILDSGSTPTLTRLDRDGQIVWQQETNNVGTLRCNDQGDCYVLVSTPTPYTPTSSIVKYDTNGTLEWRVTPDISPPDEYEAQSIAFDSAGNVLVSWMVHNDETYAVWTFLLMLDSNGDQLWQELVKPADYNVWLHDIRFTADDSIIATGSRFDRLTDQSAGAGDNKDTGRRFRTMFFNSSHEVVWFADATCNPETFSSATQVIEDPENNILVLGYCDDEVVLLKYDREANLLWRTDYDSNENGTFSGSLHVDANGDSLIYGSDYPASFFMKIDSDGVPQWYHGFEPTEPGQTESRFRALAIDADTNVYVIGYSRFSDPSEATYEFFTKKFSPTGEELWSVNFFADQADPPEKAADDDVSIVAAYPFQLAILPAADDTDDDDDDNDDAIDDDATDDDDGDDDGDDDTTDDDDGGDDSTDDDSTDDDATDDDNADDDDDNNNGCGC